MSENKKIMLQKTWFQPKITKGSLVCHMYLEVSNKFILNEGKKLPKTTNNMCFCFLSLINQKEKKIASINFIKITSESLFEYFSLYFACKTPGVIKFLGKVK